MTSQASRLAECASNATKSICVKDPDGLGIEVFCDCGYDPNGAEAQDRAELEG